MIEYKKGKGVIESIAKEYKVEKYRKKIPVRNCIVTIDTETSSWFDVDGKALSVNSYYELYDVLSKKEKRKLEKMTEKRACLYLWTIAVEDNVFFGREKTDLIECLNDISEFIGKGAAVIVWDQNLEFDIQWIKKQIKIIDSFAVNATSPVYIMTENGIIFRDTLVLSRSSLERMGKEVGIEKLVGDLDYNKIRHSKTYLTKEEMLYAERDVKVLVEWIRKKRGLENGKLSKIPLTMTGYARREMRDFCLYNKEKVNGSNLSYKALISGLNISCEKEYEMLKKAFRGGFVHGSSQYIGKKLYDVFSFDYCSKYLSVMLMNKFPMCTGKYIENPSNDEIKLAFDNLSLIDVSIFGMKDAFIWEHFLSSSTCEKLENAILDNGRVVSCSYCRTVLTNVDLEVLMKAYDIDNIQINAVVIYGKSWYLPRPFIIKCMDLYEKKTKYKGIEDKSAEYLLSKIKVNSMAGLLEEDIKHLKWRYDENAILSCKSHDDDFINKYNNNKSRFTFYPWGVFLTAFARRDIWDGIFELGSDYVYSDTDSLKFLNFEKHKDYFEKCNVRIMEESIKICECRKYEVEKLYPEDIKGEQWFLGIFDYEGKADEFKMLGAKRYMQKKNGKLQIAISGISKTIGRNYFESTGDPLSEFCFDCIVPRKHTGKLIHTYCDQKIKGKVIDYLGAEGEYEEDGFVHLSPCEYNFGIEDSFESYLSIIQ